MIMIIINGKKHNVEGNSITYDRLCFLGNADFSKAAQRSDYVKWKMPYPEVSTGILEKDHNISIKQGMEFTVGEEWSKSFGTIAR